MNALSTIPAPAWGPIGQEVFNRTYSRTLDDGSKETWIDTVTRVVDSNTELGGLAVEDGERDRLFELISEMKLLPAGRHLWAAGAETTLGLFNCHRAGWDGTLSGHFTFTFDQLMLGGGVGANYSQDFLDESPAVGNRVSLELRLDPGHPDIEEASWDLSIPTTARTEYVIEDSREGWIAALRYVIDAHTIGHDYHLVLDASQVRPRGSLILGFGGIASGPGPLLAMLNSVNRSLNLLSGHRLDPISAMDIDHEIASCVISGNVRRSARMSILHWEDPAIFDFLGSKDDPSKHWTTNISVEVDDRFFEALDGLDLHAHKVLEEISRRSWKNGEPGVFNSSAASVGERGDVRSTNPCGEIALEAWEQCCLGHVNLAAFADDHEGALEAFRLMSRFLLRATLARSSDRRQEAVKARNRRIGVGFTGFHDWAALQGIRYSEIPDSPRIASKLQAYRLSAQRAAADYALELGVEVPVKTTTVAPTGSISKLPGVSEGIQPPFARYFIRRVRYASTDPQIPSLIASGYDVEPCQYSENTLVVSFPCRDEIMDKVPADLVEAANEVPIETYLRVQALVQETFADNAISITVNFEREATSPVELASLLATFLPKLKGTTLMPEDGRPQSPYERISEGAYRSARHHGVGQAFDDCSSGACPIR